MSSCFFNPLFRLLSQTSRHIPVAILALCLATAAEAAPCTVAAPVAPNAKTDVIYDPADSSMKACVAGNWVVLAAGGGGATNLAALSDVSLSSPALNNVLLFNGTSWVNSALTVTESDPQVGTLTANKWCAANAFGTAIDCTQDAPSGGSSQWTDGTGGAIYYNGGNVGIGTTSPNARLSLGVNIAQQSLLLYENANVRYGFGIQPNELRTFAAAGAVLTFGHVSAVNGATYSENLRVDASGRVGIGTTAPSAMLHVAGQARISSTLTPQLSLIREGNTNASIYYSNNTGGVYAGSGTGGSFAIGQTPDLSTSPSFIVTSGGAVGIGTTTPPQSALHVPDGKYAQFEDFNAGAPPVADCDTDAERGRQSIDITNFRLYICMGAARGWDFIALSD